MIAGAAVGDVDADGDDDLYVTRLDAPNLLFINEGGTFVERAADEMHALNGRHERLTGERAED